MNGSNRVLLLIAIGLLLVVSQAQATTIFQDGFETYTASSSWPSPVFTYTGPGTPPIGDPWTTRHAVAAYNVRVLDIAAGGTFAGPHSGSNYLQTSLMDLGEYAAANISTANQTLVASNKNLTLDMWVYKNSLDAYSGDDRLIGLDAAPGLTTGRAFDLIFKEDGTLAYDDGAIKATGLLSPVETWQHLIVTANFATHTYDVTLGAQPTVHGLAFADSTISKIQNVYTAGIGYYNTRMSLDDITMTTIPEPGTLALLATGLIGLLAYAWRKRR